MAFDLLQEQMESFVAANPLPRMIEERIGEEMLECMEAVWEAAKPFKDESEIVREWEQYWAGWLAASEFEMMLDELERKIRFLEGQACSNTSHGCPLNGLKRGANIQRSAPGAEGLW